MRNEADINLLTNTRGIVIFCSLLSFCRWKPSFFRKLLDFREMYSFPSHFPTHKIISNFRRSPFLLVEFCFTPQPTMKNTMQKGEAQIRKKPVTHIAFVVTNLRTLMN